jgi:undecaprenyl-diphosphatase
MAAIYLVKNLRALFMLITASAATGAVVEILKLLIERVRPGLDIFPKYVSMSYSSSFPSGHTALAFLTAVILSKYYPKYAKTFYTVAFFVGYFRLYMGVHYLTDVIGGALVGCIMGLTFLLYEKDVMSFEAKILKCLKSKFKR